ncbi:glycosyltransferase [Sulfuracidifex tepidarius]|nr:glycosyltransferase family 2 protein [Sulfuracidifex tepidarius]
MDSLYALYILLVSLAFISDVLIALQILSERRLSVHYSGDNPKASVIIPIRGSDECLASNVKSLLEQDYPDYEVIYVVDTDQKALAERLSGMGVKVVFSDFQCEMCSGKIRAQLSGLKSSDGDVIVFGDSDTRYDRGWLKEMVGGLKEFDATTTYPWPSPTKLTLKNLVRSGFWT